MSFWLATWCGTCVEHAWMQRFLVANLWQLLSLRKSPIRLDRAVLSPMYLLVKYILVTFLEIIRTPLILLMTLYLQTCQKSLKTSPTEMKMSTKMTFNAKKVINPNVGSSFWKT